MPIYEYECSACDIGVFEVVQKMSDEPVKVCPRCGASVKRVMSLSSFHLKGSGWYKTDYGAKNGTQSASSHASSDKKDKAQSAEVSSPAEGNKNSSEKSSDSSTKTDTSSNSSAKGKQPAASV